MNARTYNRTIRKLKNLVDKLNEKGHIGAVVYGDKSGIIMAYGNEVVTETLNMAGLMDTFSGMDAMPTEVAKRVAIPPLSKPIAKMSVMDLRYSIPAIMAGMSDTRQNIGWGKEERRPTWWPAGVAFTNPKQRPVDFKGKLLVKLFSMLLYRL